MQSSRIAMALALILTACAPPVSHPMHEMRAGRVSAGVSRTRPDAPVLVRKKNGHYVVSKPWTVVLDGETWHIQKGYRSNGITGPATLKHTLGDGVNEPETWAAMFHDWLFTQPGMTRDKADRLFYQILVAYGVSPLKSRIMYSGVSAYSASKNLR